MAVMAVSCIDKTPDYGNFATKDVDFTYRVDDDRYGLDFYVVSTVEFTNTSSKTGSVSWDLTVWAAAPIRCSSMTSLPC